jgi:ElaB/YqjD/DUF883 family membrane-anchored ribosome-binding protein
LNTNIETDTKQPAAEVVDTAKQAAQEQVDHAREKGRSALRDQVDRRSTNIGGQAHTLADSLRHSASQMRAEGDPRKARYAGFADQGAERLERLGGYLTDADADEILGKAEDLARRQPWLIAGAGVLVGIAAARFMKASSSERYQSRLSTTGALQPARVGSWDPASLPAVTPEPLVAGRSFDEKRFER